MRPVGSAEELERRRRRAIALLEQGEKPSVIVRILGISWVSLCRWREAAKQGVDGLAAKARKGRMRLSPEQLPDNTGAKVEDTIAFLRLLRRHLGSKLTICWDRGRIHDHSLAVRQWLAEHKGIRAERFPPYAPDLNPDEYVWSYAKYAKLCNYAAPSLSELRERIDGELRSLAKNKTLLQSFIDHAKLNGHKSYLLYNSRNQ